MISAETMEAVAIGNIVRRRIADERSRTDAWADHARANAAEAREHRAEADALEAEVDRLSDENALLRSELAALRAEHARAMRILTAIDAKRRA